MERYSPEWFSWMRNTAKKDRDETIEKAEIEYQKELHFLKELEDTDGHEKT